MSFALVYNLCHHLTACFLTLLVFVALLIDWSLMFPSLINSFMDYHYQKQSSRSSVCMDLVLKRDSDWFKSSTVQYRVWTGSYRGVRSPPGHCRGFIQHQRLHVLSTWKNKEKSNQIKNNHYHNNKKLNSIRIILSLQISSHREMQYMVFFEVWSSNPFFMLLFRSLMVKYFQASASLGFFLLLLFFFLNTIGLKLVQVRPVRLRRKRRELEMEGRHSLGHGETHFIWSIILSHL